MIKRLKNRFILINMSIIATIVVCLFTVICVFTYNSQTAQTLKYLELSISRGDNFSIKEENSTTPPPEIDFSAPADEPFDMPNIYAFRVYLDRDGNIVNSGMGGEEIGEEFLTKTVLEALESKSESGRVNDGELMFLKKDTALGSVIAFTSTEPMDSSIRTTVLLSLCLCLACLVIFFIISERLAHYAVKPVKSAWDSQKQFVADASHDLKTPLTVILANNDILLAHKDDTIENQQKWIESTGEEALKMKGLVTQMLDLAKSENAHSLVFGKVNLSEITEGEILQLEPIAFEKQVTVCSNVQKNVILNTNKEAYQRIVQTLLDNAIKYSKENEKIRISMQEERQKVYLFVNSPSYIEEKNLVHIFERFYRGDEARGEGGHGLGLAIAKNLALSLNGDLGVKSNQAEGTTFMLVLKKK